MKRIHIYLFICLLVLIMSWEYQRNVSASIVTNLSEIPEESMRLRILANSDLPADQWLKRELRDEIVKQMTMWTENMESLGEARQKVQLSIPELEDIIQEVIQSRGFSYDFEVKYGEIEFPTKLYGNRLYPAGEYEGLLITIGAGKGENWWCVLFPPLCFVDFGGEEPAETLESSETTEASKNNSQPEQLGNDEPEIEVRFFFMELLVKIKNALTSLFT